MFNGDTIYTVLYNIENVKLNLKLLNRDNI